MMDLLVAVYDPTGENAVNPLCWPYFATEADAAGLSPHVITVNELDPLRDEGIAYFRLLQRAGVPAVGKVNLGLTHAAEMSFRQAVPHILHSTRSQAAESGATVSATRPGSSSMPVESTMSRIWSDGYRTVAVIRVLPFSSVNSEVTTDTASGNGS